MPDAQPAPVGGPLPRGHLLALNRSFRRTLEAESKSPRTIEAYTDAIRILALYCEVHGSRSSPASYDASTSRTSSPTRTALLVMTCCRARHGTDPMRLGSASLLHQSPSMTAIGDEDDALDPSAARSGQLGGSAHPG